MGATEGISSEVSRNGFEVLWAGEPPAADDSVRALTERGAHVRVIPVDACAEEVAARAPDLLVLGGSACAGLEAFWSRLREREPFAMVPVALVGAEQTSIPHTDTEPRASTGSRRMGVVARLSAELASEALASELHGLLRALSTRRARWGQGVSWDQLEGWLNLTARDGSCGFLMTSEPAAAMVLGPDGQSAPSARMLKQTKRAKGPRTARFADFPAGRLAVLREAGPAAGSADLHGMRVLLVHPVAERRAALGDALRASGAELHELTKDADALTLAATFQPALIVVAAVSLIDSQAESLWREERFASCSWVVLDETAPRALTPAYVAQVASALGESRRALAMRLERGELVVGRIESFRAAGWLAVLSGVPGARHAVLEGAAGCAEVELREGTVAAVRFRAGREQPWVDGDRALEALRTLSVGRVLAGSEVAVRTRRAELAVPLHDGSPSVAPLPPAPAAASEAADAARAPLSVLAQRADDTREAGRSRTRRYLAIAAALAVCAVLFVMVLHEPSSPLGEADAARLEQAKRALADGDYGKAQPVLAELVLRHPADFALRYDLALTLLRLQRPREARAELERAMTLDAEAPQAWFLLGESHLEDKNLPEALEAWKRCLEVRRGYLPCEERLATWRE